MLCQNCTKQMGTNFCEHCGEKRFSSRDLSLFQLMKNLFSLLTDVDSKLLKTYWSLFRKPGRLTLDYINGKHKSRINPFQVFIIANILYFFLISFFQINTFNTPLNFHLNSNNFIHKEIANEFVQEKISLSKLNLEQYSNKFNKKADVYSKSLVILMIPMFSVFVLFLFFRYAKMGVKSLVYSVHFISFILLFQIAILSIFYSISWMMNIVFSFDIRLYLFSESTLSATLLVGIFIYLMISTKVVFGNKIWVITLKSVLLALCFYFTLLLYRMALFFITFYTI